MTKKEMLREIFAKDSTGNLIKRFLFMKALSTNFFINFSLPLIKTFYKTLGIRITNGLIAKTVGPIYTSGKNLETLMQDVASFR